MIKRILTAIFIIFCAAVLHAQEKPSDLAGMKISKSYLGQKRESYKIDAPAKIEEAVIIIEGDNIIVDFSKVRN